MQVKQSVSLSLSPTEISMYLPACLPAFNQITNKQTLRFLSLRLLALDPSIHPSKPLYFFSNLYFSSLQMVITAVAAPWISLGNSIPFALFLFTLRSIRHFCSLYAYKCFGLFSSLFRLAIKIEGFTFFSSSLLAVDFTSNFI